MIDADALVEKIESEIYRYWNGGGGGYYLAEDAVKEVEAAPTVEAVRHGKWICISEPDENDNVQCNCSVCGARDLHAKDMVVPYCWKCGANMDGVIDYESERFD